MEHEGSENCCATDVLEANEICGNGVVAPCVIENYTPAPMGVPGVLQPFGELTVPPSSFVLLLWWRLLVLVVVCFFCVVVICRRTLVSRSSIEHVEASSCGATGCLYEGGLS